MLRQVGVIHVLFFQLVMCVHAAYSRRDTPVSRTHVGRLQMVQLINSYWLQCARPRESPLLSVGWWKFRSQQ